ncbi:MAG: hypothetical protein LBV40_02055 [Methanomicrobiales archaeon]|nr:hypothetical protein [Methanomicrobiales archaeon]
MINIHEDTISYQELGDIAEQIFTVCEDDPIRVATKLGTLSPNIRDLLLESDLLNAFQVFYYYFRESPDIVAEEILLFHSAAHLIHGISLLKGIGPYEMVFLVKQGKPMIVIIDEDDLVLKTCTGTGAYREAISFIRENS